MKITLLILGFTLMFSGCANKHIEPKIKYVYKTKYIYLPCKQKSVKKQTILKKDYKLKKNSRKTKSYTYKKTKPTKIFAPKKYITMPNKKMDFMMGINKDNSYFVYLEGAFGKETYRNFLKFLKNVPDSVKEIKINSNGGVLATAMEIGAFVHKNRWDTGVDKEMKCMSACGFVYFAGKNKSLQGKAVVGLHRPYYPDIPDTQKMVRKIKKDYISYWNYIRAPKSIYDEMMEVDRDDLFILDRNNINEYIDIKIK